MKKLVNFSTCKSDLDRFNNEKEKIRQFMKSINVDGIELIGVCYLDENIMPCELIESIHLRYYPTWLDFWRGDKKEVLRQLKNEENIKMTYGGMTKQAIVEDYRKEIRKAEEFGASYMVFHVSHVQLEHVYNYDFTYTDEEVVDATIELVNEIFKDFPCTIPILFENLWWPGLTMLDKSLVKKLLDEVKYEHKGLMLDTGHLINTNLDIKTENQAIDYILEKIENLGELKDYIKAIHLNYSLSGEYTKNKIVEYKKNPPTFEEMYTRIFDHVLSIDQHMPFTSKRVQEIVNAINPEFVVYELITNSPCQLAKYVDTQNNALSWK